MKDFDDFSDLTGKNKVLKCKYHGTHNPYLEGIISKELVKHYVVGVSLWKEDVAKHSYDNNKDSLDIWYKAPDPNKIRAAVLVMEEFTVPKSIKEINVYDI